MVPKLQEDLLIIFRVNGQIEVANESWSFDWSWRKVLLEFNCHLFGALFWMGFRALLSFTLWFLLIGSQTWAFLPICKGARTLSNSSSCRLCSGFTHPFFALPCGLAGTQPVDGFILWIGCLKRHSPQKNRIWDWYVIPVGDETSEIMASSQLKSCPKAKVSPLNEEDLVLVRKNEGADPRISEKH